MPLPSASLQPPVPLARLANRFLALPAALYLQAAPVAVANPALLCFNSGLAEELGLDWHALDDATLAAVFSGNRPLQGSTPVALAYAGHQFGNFVPRLGDGRAILLGDLTARNGQPYDLQLKGSGPTPFSRRGDGRAGLGPVLREYVVSEAMHALGIPSTRALAAVATGEPVLREQVLPGAVLTRVAPSHVRVGTFQYLAARDDLAGLMTLTRYMIDHHYPALREAPVPALALLEAVAERQVQLVAQWLQVGFIHGVMNTDNTAIAGHTLDFGPCAFLERYDPATVFSAIDTQGRYAFGQQPAIAAWNLARLAEALLPLLAPEPGQAVDLAQALIDGLEVRSTAAWQAGMARKLALAGVLPAAADPTAGQPPDPADGALIDDLMTLLHRQQADYTLSLRSLADALPHAGASSASAAPAADGVVPASGAPPFANLLREPAAAAPWLARWHARLLARATPMAAARASMLAHNPLYLPRNHLVEAALQAAAANDLAPLRTLQAVLARPFEVHAGADALARPATPQETVTRTFCGT